MSNLYNAASVNVTSAVSTPPVRCGGIIGRIYQGGEIGSLTSCLNIGTVTYKGSGGYAINGYSQNTAASSNTANITGCYYLEGSGIAYTEGGSVSESDLKSEALAEKLGADYWYISKSGQVMPKVTDGKVVVPIPSPTFADGDQSIFCHQRFHPAADLRRRRRRRDDQLEQQQSGCDHNKRKQGRGKRRAGRYRSDADCDHIEDTKDKDGQSNRQI